MGQRLLQHQPSAKRNYRLNLIASSEAVIGTKNPKLNNSKKPDWQKSTAGSTLIYNYVEVPLKYSHKVATTIGIVKNPNQEPEVNQKLIDAGFDRLIIYRNKKGKIDQRIISFIPDKDYLERHNGNVAHNRIDKIDADFKGYLQYKDWEGKPLFVLRVENGRPIKKYDMRFAKQQKVSSGKPAASKGKTMVVDAGEDPENCYFVTWDWYQDCVYATPESTVPLDCGPVIIVNVQYFEIACPPPGGGNGGGPSGPGDPEECLGFLVFATGECIEEQEDCAGVLGGTAYLANCGCIGGTTGIDSCAIDPCNQAKVMNFRNKNQKVADLNITLDSKSTNKEWGAEVRLMADGLTSFATLPTSNGENSYEPTFTFNSTDGYTVGFNHTHKTTGTDIGYPAPSPGDILTPFARAYSPGVTSTGKQQFYMDNMWVGIRSGNNKYIITVNNWQG